MAVAVGEVLLDLVVILAAAKLAGEVAERLHQPSVLGELLAGFLLGPTVLGFLDFGSGGAHLQLIAFLASLGAILLLFEVGLETRFSDLVKVGPSAMGVALIGIVASFFAGAGASWMLARWGVWDDMLLLHVFVGATFTATSVGITARVLSDMGRLATAEARVILGAAVLDDVGGLLILAAMSALAAGSLDGWSIARQAGLAFLFLGLVLAIGMRLAPRVLDALSRARVRGVLVTASVGSALLLAYLAEQVHLAAIVGAFAAGVVLAQTRQQHAIAERARTLADLLVPIFFVYVGMQVDLRGVGGDAGRLALVAGVLLVAALAGKLLSGLGVLGGSVARWPVAIGMVPRGEVGLIFAVVGLTTLVGDEPLLDAFEYGAVLIVVAATTVVTPLWLKASLARVPARP